MTKDKEAPSDWQHIGGLAAKILKDVIKKREQANEPDHASK